MVLKAMIPMFPGLWAKLTIISAPQVLGRRFRIVLTRPPVFGSAIASIKPPYISAYIKATIGKAMIIAMDLPRSLPRAVFTSLVLKIAARTVPIQREERIKTMKIRMTIKTCNTSNPRGLRRAVNNPVTTVIKIQ